MTPRVRLPRWVTTTIGLAVTAWLTAAVTGLVPRAWWPRLGPVVAPGPADAPHRADAAEARMRRCARAIYDAKQAAGVPLDEGGPPDEVGLIGAELTPFVTTLGHLEAKRLSARPVWARVLTRELARHGVGQGSVVAANFSGSFPGLNLAVMCACQELGARLVAVTSVTASTWGATDPGFSWPEMEVRLVRLGLLRPASVAVSIGGEGDRGLDLDEDARQAAAVVARTAARALGAAYLEPATADEAVRLRIDALDRARADAALTAFVNVGGAEASVGRSSSVLQWQNGWLPPAAEPAPPSSGLVPYLRGRGTPVLHVLNVRDLAVRWNVRD